MEVVANHVVNVVCFPPLTNTLFFWHISKDEELPAGVGNPDRNSFGRFGLIVHPVVCLAVAIAFWLCFQEAVSSILALGFAQHFCFIYFSAQ